MPWHAAFSACSRRLASYPKSPPLLRLRLAPLLLDHSSRRRRREIDRTMVLRQAAAAAVEPSALGRKRAMLERGGGVRRVAFAIEGMSSAARRRLAARFESELASVRALLKKAVGFLAAPEAPAGGEGKSGLRTDSSSSSPAKRKDGQFLAAAAASAGVQSGGGAPVKKRKACFLSGRGDAQRKKKRTPEWPDAGKRLLAAGVEQPAQIGDGELLRRNLHGDSKIDKPRLDNCTEETRNHRHERPMIHASAVIHTSPSPSPRHRQEIDKTGVKGAYGVYICGGASAVPTALSPLLLDDVNDYGELVGATGVDVLSPLQRKYIALAERTDVCGGAVAPALSLFVPPGYGEFAGATGVHHLLSPLPLKHAALAERVDAGVSTTAAKSPSLPPGYGELIADATGVVETLSPLPHEHVALAERVDVVSPCVVTSPSPPPGFSELVADATGVKMMSPLARKYAALATEEEEDDEYVDICGDVSPLVIQKINHGEIISNSSSSDSDSTSSSDDSDSDASGAATAAGNSTPTPAIPTNAPPPSEFPQSATKQEENIPEHRAAVAATTPSAKPLTDLIARAQGAVSRRRQEAREKARQELEKMERTTAAEAAMASNAVHPMDMELLGLAAVERMVSSDVEEVRRALSFGSAALRATAPSWPSLVEELGLFLKSDGGSDKEDQQRQRQQPPSFAAGVDDDVEEGEIR